MLRLFWIKLLLIRQSRVFRKNFFFSSKRKVNLTPAFVNQPLKYCVFLYRLLAIALRGDQEALASLYKESIAVKRVFH